MDYVTFVVRIRLDERHSMSEGQITHVASQETGYFRDLGAAVAFRKSTWIRPMGGPGMAAHGGNPPADERCQ